MFILGRSHPNRNKYRVLDRELDETLGLIRDSKNPEIHHYHRGSHPGIGWYIKTILPGPNILTDDVYPLFAMWQAIQKRMPSKVNLANRAYGWHGEPIDNWWTIWLNNRIDIEVTWSRTDGFDWSMVDYDVGLRNSATRIIEWANANIDDRHRDGIPVSYGHICEIASFLETYTPEHRSRQNRSKLRVLTDGEILPKTDN